MFVNPPLPRLVPWRKALQEIPYGAHAGWNRYYTDDEEVLSLHADGQTWDVRWPRHRTAYPRKEEPPTHERRGE